MQILNYFSGWLCNLLVWGAVVTFVVLLYETFWARGFLVSHLDQMTALIVIAAVAVVSLFWPRY